MNQSLERYEGALSVADLKQHVQLIQHVMRDVMISGVHYGTIPGCGNKPTLLKPGADTLSMTFHMAPTYEILKTDLPNGHREYQITCCLSHIHSKVFLGQGLGVATTMESKHRFRNAAKKCPVCQKETIIKGRAEYGGGWICYAAKGGCGEKWNDGYKGIEDQKTGKVEHENPADFYNTVIKMGKKRAHVDAVLTVTAASDIFTQDIEENVDDGKSNDISKNKDSTTTPTGNGHNGTNSSETPPSDQDDIPIGTVTPIRRDNFVTPEQATTYRKESVRLKIPTKMMKAELKKHGISMPDKIPADQFDARFKELEFLANEEKKEVAK